METITIRQRGLAPVIFGVALGVVAVVLFRAVAPWLGLLLGAVALLILLGRHDLRVDGTAEAAMWWTLLGLPLMKLRGAAPAAVREVVLAKEQRRGSKGRTYHVYPVRLDGTAPLALWEESSQPRGRRLAEQVAKALRKPLRDEALGEPVVRQPAELDLSLGERLRARGRPPAVPPLSAGSGLTLTRAGEGGEAVLALPGSKPPALAAVLGLGVPVLLGGTFFAVASGIGRFIGVAFALLFLAFFGWALLAAARTSTLTLGRDFVASRGRGRSRRIPLAKLEEVRVDGDDVVLLSDETTLTVPYDCRDEAEARFLAGVVALAAYHHPGGALPAFSPAQGTSGEPLEAGPPPLPPGPFAATTSGGAGATSRPPALRPRSARSLGLGLFLAAAVLLGVAGWLAADNLRFAERAARAPGEVVELVTSRGSKGGTLYSPIVRWQPLEGEPRTLRSRTASSPAAFTVGERVTVLYDPEDPGEARIQAFSEQWLAASITGGMGTLFLLIAGATLAFRRVH